MLMLVYGLPTLAMVLERPHLRPQVLVVGRYHAALAARGHYLVLAERPRANITYGADHPIADARTVRLGAVLNHRNVARSGYRHYIIHVCRPSAQMHGNDRTCSIRQRRFNGRGRDIAAVAIDIDEHRGGAGVDDRRDRSDESSGRDNNFVA